MNGLINSATPPGRWRGIRKIDERGGAVHKVLHTAVQSSSKLLQMLPGGFADIFLPLFVLLNRPNRNPGLFCQCLLCQTCIYAKSFQLCIRLTFS